MNYTDAHPGGARPVSRTLVLVVTTISSFLTPFMSSSINVALPVIGEEFSMDAILLGWVSTSFLLSSAMFLVPFGRAGDLFGRGRVFTAGLWLYTLASLLCAASFSAASLIAFRILQGVGSTMVFATGTAILISAFPPEERGRALGINVTGVYLGISLGPFIGGFLTHALGWRSVFYANILVGLAILAMAWRIIRRERPTRDEASGPFDIRGTLAYAAVIPLVMYGLSALPSVRGIVLLAAGSIVFFVFLMAERSRKNPLVPLSLFSNRVFAFSNLAALINYSATFASSFLLSLYLQYIKGMSPQYAGLVLVAQPAVMALFSPAAGRLSDRVSARVIASAGMALTTIGLLLCSFLGAATPLWYILCALVVMGLGFALFSSPNTNAVMGSVERRSYGIASAVIGTMRLFGMMLSMGAIMIIFTVIIGRVRIEPHNYADFLIGVRVAFAVSTAICALGVLPSLAREANTGRGRGRGA